MSLLFFIRLVLVCKITAYYIFICNLINYMCEDIHLRKLNYLQINVSSDMSCTFFSE